MEIERLNGVLSSKLAELKDTNLRLEKTGQQENELRQQIVVLRRENDEARAMLLEC